MTRPRTTLRAAILLIIGGTLLAVLLDWLWCDWFYPGFVFGLIMGIIISILVIPLAPSDRREP